MAKKTIRENAPELITAGFAKAQPWQTELCEQLRQLVHKAIPEVVEDWKWGPNFNYHGMVCGIWYFKKHVSLVFFNGSSLADQHQILASGTDNVNNRTYKVQQGETVPWDILEAYLQEAAKNNEQGIKATRNTLEVPEILQQELMRFGAWEAFQKKNHTAQKEMIVAITSAKKEETRARRLQKIIAELAN